MNKLLIKGKMTYIGILISAAGAAGKLVGVDVPTDNINSMLDMLMANWDTIAQFGGLLIAAYGRLRASWPSKK